MAAGGRGKNLVMSDSPYLRNTVASTTVSSASDEAPSADVGEWGRRCEEEQTGCSFCFSPAPASASLLLGARDEVPACRVHCFRNGC